MCRDSGDYLRFKSAIVAGGRAGCAIVARLFLKMFIMRANSRGKIMPLYGLPHGFGL